MWNFFINYNLITVFWYYHHSWKDNYLQRHVQAPTLFPFVRPNSLGCCPISKSSELGTLGYKSGRKYRGQGYWVMRTEGEKIWCSGKKISPGVRQTLVSYFLHLPHPSLNFLICRMVIIKSLSYTRSGVLSCWPGHRMYKCRCFHPLSYMPLAFDGASLIAFRLVYYHHLLDCWVLRGQGLSPVHFSSLVTSSVPGKYWSLHEWQLYWAAFSSAKEFTVISEIWRRVEKLGKKQNRAIKDWSCATSSLIL